MGRLRDLRGVVIRNLVLGDSIVPTADRNDPCGSCFSIHLVDARSGDLCEEAVYTSTLCAQACNPSWADIDHEDMTVMVDGSETAYQRWVVGQFGIRVWRCGNQGGSAETGDQPRPNVIPRVAAWERLKRQDEQGNENGFVGERKGSVAGAPEVPRVSTAAATAAAYGSLRFELAFEVKIVLDEWIKVETPLSQLQLPLPRNSLLVMLSDASGRVGTYFDPNDAGILSVMNRASVLAGRKPRGKDKTHSKEVGSKTPPTARALERQAMEGYRSDGYRSDGRSTDGKVDEGYRSDGSGIRNKLEHVVDGRGGSSKNSLSSSPVGSVASDHVRDGGAQGVIPRACQFRSEALEAMRSAAAAQKKAAALAAGKLEKLLSVQVEKEEVKRRKNECAARLRQLRKKVQEEERAVAEQRALVKAEQSKQESVHDADAARSALQARAVVLLCRQGMVDAIDPDSGEAAVPLPEALESANKKIEDGVQRLMELNADLKVRQHFLIAALHSAYPITTAPDGVTRTICGLVLPSPQMIPNSDDETVSTALGHVCHLVALIAKYSSVYLRFQPIPMSSRSLMRDKVLGATRSNSKDGNDFPLFLKGQDRFRVQNAVYMVARDVEQLMAAHGLAPAESAVQVTPHGHQSTILMNLQNIIISCRQKLLAALGGFEAFKCLNSATVATLAMSKDEAAKLAGARQIVPKKAEGGSGVRKSAGSSGSSSNASARMSGSEYVSGLAKGVDRMLENLLFPSVSTAASGGESGAGEDGVVGGARVGRSDSRKSRELAKRGGKEGKEGKEGKKSKEERKSAKVWEGVEGEEKRTSAEQPRGSGGARGDGEERVHTGEAAERGGEVGAQDRGELEDGTTEGDSAQGSSGRRPTGAERGGTVSTRASAGGLEVAGWDVSLDYGQGGGQAFYERYKAAADGTQSLSGSWWEADAKADQSSTEEGGKTLANGESGPGSGGGWLGALSEAGSTLSSIAEQGMNPVDRTIQYLMFPEAPAAQAPAREGSAQRHGESLGPTSAAQRALRMDDTHRTGSEDGGGKATIAATEWGVGGWQESAVRSLVGDAGVGDDVRFDSDTTELWMAPEENTEADEGAWAAGIQRWREAS